MELTLRRSDIDPRYSSRAWHTLQFRHLTAEAKAAVRAAGIATLRSDNGGCYEAIHPPKRKPWAVRTLLWCALSVPVAVGGAIAVTAGLGGLGVKVVAVPGGVVLVDNIAQVAAQVVYGLWGMLIYSTLFRKA